MNPATAGFFLRRVDAGRDSGIEQGRCDAHEVLQWWRGRHWWWCWGQMDINWRCLSAQRCLDWWGACCRTWRRASALEHEPAADGCARWR